MISEQDLAKALESLLRQANPNITFSSLHGVLQQLETTFSSLHGVLQQLESKLGLDLSHKVDFVRNHIHFLFRPPPPPQLLHHHPPPTPQQQSPNFHLTPSFTLHRPEEFAFRPQQSALPQVTNIEPYAPNIASTATTDVAATAAEPTKKISQKGKKRRGGLGSLNKLCGVSPLLQAIVCQPALPRTEIVKQLWVYIRKNNLQDPNNKRKLICNDELGLVFETDCTDMFKMNKLLAKHIIPLEPSEQPGQNSKKLKANGESESKNMHTVPIVIISEALANFFGTDEREMSQAETCLKSLGIHKGQPI